MAKRKTDPILNPSAVIAEAIKSLGVSTEDLCGTVNQLTKALKDGNGYLGYCRGRQVYGSTMADYLSQYYIYVNTYVIITDDEFMVDGARPVLKGATGDIVAWYHTETSMWDWMEETISVRPKATESKTKTGSIQPKSLRAKAAEEAQAAQAEVVTEEDWKWLIYY